MPKKKLLTRTAAYVLVCPICKADAIIVLSFGKRTKVFNSKKAGHELINLLLEGKHIIKEEAIFLRESLNGSPLDEESVIGDILFSAENIFPEEEGGEVKSQPKHQKWVN